MRPSQLSAVLGLDEYDAVRPVPFPDELVAEAERIEHEGGGSAVSQPARRQLSVRRIVGGDDA